MSTFENVVKMNALWFPEPSSGGVVSHVSRADAGRLSYAKKLHGKVRPVAVSLKLAAKKYCPTGKKPEPW
jgi:hypothetical protein